MADEHLRDPARWYIKDKEADARLERFRVTERPVHGWTDWRAVYGTSPRGWRYRLRTWWRDAAWPRVRHWLRRAGVL